MKKKRNRPNRAEPIITTEPALVEVFSMDPDAHVVPTAIGIPSWVFTYDLVLEKQAEEFLARVNPDAYNKDYMSDVIQAKLGEAKSAVYSQLSGKLYNVSERRRAQLSKIAKLQGQIAILEAELADYEKELSELERAWDDRGPLM